MFLITAAVNTNVVHFGVQHNSFIIIPDFCYSCGEGVYVSDSVCGPEASTMNYTTVSCPTGRCWVSIKLNVWGAGVYLGLCVGVCIGMGECV